MTNTQHTPAQRTPDITLLALGLLSILFGMVLLEMLWVVDQLPAWNLLPIFFAVAVLVKLVEAQPKHSNKPSLPLRLVTVEYRWHPTQRRNSYGFAL